MTTQGSRITQYLTLDKLVVNPKLARCLPPDLAFRYHSLPVAKDNGRITVAMANPDDRIAREAVSTALGAKLYVVRADPATIDRLLAKIWPEETGEALRLLVYHQGGPITEKVQGYARYLGDLLGGQLNSFQTGDRTEATFDELVEAASCGQDLVIFEESDQPLIKRLLAGPMGCKAAERVPTSVLIARWPRYPLKRMLLVTRSYETDNVAVDWIVRLAQPSNAAITVLAVIPSMSAMNQKAVAYMPHGLTDWLTTDTPLGQQLRRIARQLMNWELQGRLRFRQGSPVGQIKEEMSEGDYDLIIIAADPIDWWLRRLLGELVSPLLHWIDRPVLIAKPTIT